MPLGPLEELEIYFQGHILQWVVELRYTDGRRYQIELVESQMYDLLHWIRDTVEKYGGKVIPELRGYTVVWGESENHK